MSSASLTWKLLLGSQTLRPKCDSLTASSALTLARCVFLLLLLWSMGNGGKRPVATTISRSRFPASLAEVSSPGVLSYPLSLSLAPRSCVDIAPSFGCCRSIGTLGWRPSTRGDRILTSCSIAYLLHWSSGSTSERPAHLGSLLPEDPLRLCAPSK